MTPHDRCGSHLRRPPAVPSGRGHTPEAHLTGSLPRTCARIAALACAVSLAAAACSSPGTGPETASEVDPQTDAMSGTGDPPDEHDFGQAEDSGERSAATATACESAAVDSTAASDSEPGAGLAVDPPRFVGVEGYAVYTSIDGICWTRQAIELNGNEKAVVYGDGRIVVVGPGGELVVSDDGHQWNHTENENLVGISAVAYGDNTYVGVGEAFAGVIVPVSAVSRDGLTWTHNVVDLPHGFQSVTFGADRFVAVGSGLIAYSEDGINWTRSAFREPRQLFDVVYGDNRFVAVGGRGAIYSSPDGLTWNEETSGLSREFFLRSVTYGNGMFVAVGDLSSSARSLPAKTVSSGVSSTPVQGSHSETSPTATTGLWQSGPTVARPTNGEIATSSNGVVLTSANGTDWTATEVGGPLSQA